ncbi:MAG: hypothetical protein GY768_19730 [Planctomycetaceae bacterium]|nr:hypothetical protein [Planctomycetaceae bacterium]
MDANLIKVLVIAGAGGLIGSLGGGLLAIFGKGNTNMRVENTTAIGFLVGGALGALLGIFATMLDRV